MMAGPGSEPTGFVVLNESSLWDLLNDLYEVKLKWKWIGLGLGFSVSDLEAMSGSPLECLQCMLSRWLKGIKPQPTWDALVNVLKAPMVDEIRKAQELEDKFCCSSSITASSASNMPESSVPLSDDECHHDDTRISSRVRPSLCSALNKIHHPEVRRKLKWKDYRFRTLVRETQRYVSNTIQTKENLNDFKVAVTLLPASLDGHHILLAANDRKVIMAATETAPIFVVLNQYWLLEYVIKEFGSDSLKQKIKAYVTDMDKIETEIGISHVTAVQLCFPCSDSVPVEVHLRGSQHTLRIPRFVQRAMAEQRGLHPHTVRTFRSVPGSMIITLLIPYSVAGHVLATLRGILPAKDLLSRPLEERMVYKIDGAETETYLALGPSKETTADRQQGLHNLDRFINRNVIEVTMTDNYEIVSRDKWRESRKKMLTSRHVYQQDMIPFQKRSIAEITPQTEESLEDVHFRMPDNAAAMTGVRLGFGTYSDVWEVAYKGRKYAAKIYRQIESEAVISSFCRERQILSIIQHRNVVSYYGTCNIRGGDTAAIVMERMEKNLSIHLKNSKLVLTQKLSLLNDIAQGLAFLHSQRPPIVHRDLTATNILLDSRMVAKIADFGTSVLIDNETPCLLTPFPGTTEYMPPEAADGDYSEKLDVFSFGHLSIYVLNQQQPCPLLRCTYVKQGEVFGHSEIERRKQYLDKVIEFLDGEDKASLYYTLSNCLKNDPNLRPSTKDIIDSGVLSVEKH